MELVPIFKSIVPLNVPVVQTTTVGDVKGIYISIR